VEFVYCSTTRDFSTGTIDDTVVRNQYFTESYDPPYKGPLPSFVGGKTTEVRGGGALTSVVLTNTSALYGTTECYVTVDGAYTIRAASSGLRPGRWPWEARAHQLPHHFFTEAKVNSKHFFFAILNLSLPSEVARTVPVDKMSYRRTLF